MNSYEVCQGTDSGMRTVDELLDEMLFGLIWFHGTSTIAGYLIPNPLYTYILNIYDLVWLGFMAYQLL